MWRAAGWPWLLGAIGCSEPAGEPPASVPDPAFEQPEDTAGADADAIVFEPPGGGFVGELRVTLTRASGEEEGGAIHYTLDGTVPNAISPRYRQPLALGRTTQVRAALIRGAGPTRAGASAFLALDASVSDFSSNLPIVVVERHGDRSLDPSSDELRNASILIFEPDASGRAQLANPATLVSRAGVRVRGFTSRGYPQKSFSVELRHAAHEGDRDIAVLGMPAESDWVLVAPSHFDRSLMRTMFVMDLSRQIGRYASRTRFVEVFVVDREASTRLEAGDYAGVYTLAEKIKRDPARVDVAEALLPRQDGTLPDGGFIFRIDHGEADFQAGETEFQWAYPEPEVMLTPEREPQVALLADTWSEFLETLAQPDFVHPDTGKNYRDYIDVPSWIDHHLLNVLAKNVDGLSWSAYFHKDRAQPIAAGPVWDFDRSLGTAYDRRAPAADEWTSEEAAHPFHERFWGQLFRDPQFEAAYWARWDVLVEDQFAVPRLIALLDGYEAQLLEARERHFERWTSTPPSDGEPAREVELLRTWLSDRVGWINSQRP